MKTRDSLNIRVLALSTLPAISILSSFLLSNFLLDRKIEVVNLKLAEFENLEATANNKVSTSSAKSPTDSINTGFNVGPNHRDNLSIKLVQFGARLSQLESSIGSVQPVSPELQLEAKIARSSQEAWHEHVQHSQEQSFIKRWEQERGVSDWSAKKEHSIEESLQRFEENGQLQLHYFECRETLCRIELTSSHSENEEPTLNKVLDTEAFSSASRIFHKDDQRKIIFLSRNGFDLPHLKYEELAQNFNP